MMAFDAASKTIHAFTDMATQSTIFKRHEIRNRQHHSEEADKAIHPPHAPTDHSLGETFSKMNTRSTIYQHHDEHHHEMHMSIQPEEHMKPVATYKDHNHEGIGETISHMAAESTIYRRNTRRLGHLQNENQDDA